MSDDIQDRFTQCAVEIRNVQAEQVTPEARFGDDLDADSLDLVELGSRSLGPWSIAVRIGSALHWAYSVTSAAKE